jgi:hypothetical protein
MGYCVLGWVGHWSSCDHLYCLDQVKLCRALRQCIGIVRVSEVCIQKLVLGVCSFGLAWQTRTENNIVNRDGFKLSNQFIEFRQWQNFI